MKEWLQFMPAIAATASAISAIFAAVSALVNRQTAKLNNRPYLNFEGITLRVIPNRNWMELDLHFKNVGKTLLYYDVDYIDPRIKGIQNLPISHFMSYGGYIYPTASSTFTSVLIFSIPEEDEIKGTVAYSIKYGINREKYSYYIIKRFELQVNRLSNETFDYRYTFHEEFEFDNYRAYINKINEMGLQ